MKPYNSLVKHDPPNSYGDCLRASVASMLELDPVNVPHFYSDGCSAEEAQDRLRMYLQIHGLIPFTMNMPGSIPLADIFAFMAAMNPGIHYLLFGDTADGPHVVVGLNGGVAHDTAWYRRGISRPSDEGFYQIIVFVSSKTGE